MRTPLSWLPRPLLLLVTLSLALLEVPRTAQAQYFGRNKVQYDHLDFRMLPTEHYNLFFYPSESLATADAARMAERWYHRHLALFNQPYTKNPLIFYADPPDFQQSNVIEGLIGQGTGGVTEGAHDRVIMPFTGTYAESDHVLGHELVHVFQYQIAQSTRGGLANIEKIPLWLIEGMAEYLSLGRNDPNTAMWLRDALRRNDLPSLKQLTTDPRYFPYRYGQALWAFIGGMWGDDAVNRVYRTALDRGWENSLKAVLGMSADSLSKQWHAAIRREFGPVVINRAAPEKVGKPVVIVSREGDQNVSPAVSPDGKYIAFFSSRGLFGIDLYVAEVATGKVVKQLTSVTTNPHFDALSFISSAGSWSPDGKKLAFVVYADGNNEIDIVDVDSKDVERRLRVAGVGAMSDPAWSPDGQRIAFSGMKGGISDLYVYDLASGGATQLTSDREAQIQPAWSPDGKTLAFVTDAGPDTDFGTLSYGEMRLALMDVGGTAHEVKVLPPFGTGKAINPQYSADGLSIYFVSDQDGVSDVYRLTLAGGAVTRVTNIATGVSGITGLSPTLSVARGTGAVLFSVFDKQGFSIRALDGPDALGAPVTALAGGPQQSAGLLPPAAAYATSIVSLSLAAPGVGLPAPIRTKTQPYKSGLAIDYVGGPSLGVGFGGGYGTGVAGGVALGFSDMLSNNMLNMVIQAQGDIKDIGGQALYLNRSRRWNWGFEGGHIPYAGVSGFFEEVPINIDGDVVPVLVQTQVLQRVFFDEASFITQYPLSQTRRLEVSLGAQRVSFNTEVDSLYIIGNQVIRQSRGSLPSGKALTFGTGSLAYVGDYAFFGFTSPIAGGRYRVEAAPYVGSLNYATLLGDYRRYFFLRPFTLAMRGFTYGRFGSDAENQQLQPLYVGQPSLIRGYDAQSFDFSECTTAPSSQSQCPQFDRLAGSRIASASFEFRIPLFGTQQLGLFNVPFLPTEISPFFDAGVAWNKGDNPVWKFAENSTERVPVFSTGVSARINLLGFAVGEIYWVHPFQRPGRGSYWGFQLTPGW